MTGQAIAVPVAGGYATRENGAARGRGLDLSGYLAPLRTRRGKNEGGPSDYGLGAVARHMGLDPSIPQLWASGKRPVPLKRIPALRAALADQDVELPTGLEDGLVLPAPVRPPRWIVVRPTKPKPAMRGPDTARLVGACADPDFPHDHGGCRRWQCLAPGCGQFWLGSPADHACAAVAA